MNFYGLCFFCGFYEGFEDFFVGFFGVFLWILCVFVWLAFCPSVSELALA